MPRLTIRAGVAVAALAASSSGAQNVTEVVARAPTGVTPRAERLLAASAEPRRLQLRPGDDLLSLARKKCGRLTATYTELLLAANSGERRSPDTVIIPACFVTRIDETVKVVPGETWSDLAERSVGISGHRTLSRIFGDNFGRGSTRSVMATAVQPIPHHVRAVQVPSETEPVAYRIKPGIEAEALASQLRAELGAPGTLPSAPAAEPQLKLEAGVDPSVGGSTLCAPGPLTDAPNWPLPVADIAAVMTRSVARFAELSGSSDKIGVVAVVDNGMDGIFTPAFPQQDFLINPFEMAHPNDGVDQDPPGFADDVVGTNIYEGRQPIAFPGSAGIAGVASPAHGSMMASLALGGHDYRAWREQTGYPRRVKVRPVSIVRHTVEASSTGNVHRYSMPTDSLGKAIDYAAKGDAATILNLSVSTPFRLAAVEDALYNRSNLLLIVAAGNARENLDQKALYPASLSYLDSAYRGRVVTVAAHDRRGCLSHFSGRGKDSVDVAAPGEAILATGLNGIEEVGEGTSQATALVSFIAAQLRSIGMDQARLIKERLLASVDLNPAFVGNVRSEGLLNAPKALDIYKDVLELKPGGTRIVGQLATSLTVDAVCPARTGDDRKVLKVSRRIDGGDATQVRLLAKGSDEIGRVEILHCKPTTDPVAFTWLDGSPTTFVWSNVWDLVPAV